MPNYLSFDDLLAVPVAERVEKDVELPGWGLVRVRAMSTAEYWQGRASAKETGEFDDERWQAIVLSRGMVEPRLSYDEALEFARTRPYGVVVLLVTAISALTMNVPDGVLSEKAVAEAEAAFRG